MSYKNAFHDGDDDDDEEWHFKFRDTGLSTLVKLGIGTHSLLHLFTL